MLDLPVVLFYSQNVFCHFFIKVRWVIVFKDKFLKGRIRHCFYSISYHGKDKFCVIFCVRIELLCLKESRKCRN